MATANNPERRRLDSWKEIAKHLGRSARTVQRWEMEDGLPIHRLSHDQRASVFSYSDELDQWWESRSKRTATEDAPASIDESPKTTGRPLWARGWVAAGVATILIGAFLATRIGTARVPNSTGPAVPLTSYPRSEGQATLSPDGDAVAFYWSSVPANIDIFVKDVGVEEPRRLTTHPAFDFQPAWSPDGATIAFWRRQSGEESELILVPAVGGSERSLGLFVGQDTVANFNVPAPYVAWTPDGRSLVVSAQEAPGRPSRLQLLSIATGQRRILWDPPEGSRGDGGAAISRDGRKLVFHRFHGEGLGEIFLAALDADYSAAGPPVRLTFDNIFNAAPVWINDREIVFYGYRQGEMQLLRLDVGEPGAVSFVSSGEAGKDPTYSRRARRLAFTRSRPTGDIWRLALAAPGVASQAPTEWITSSRQQACPEYSPDSRLLAAISTRGGYPNVWISERDGGHLRQVTRFDSSITGPGRWSPDGRRLTVASNTGGTGEIYTLDAAGREAPRRLTHDPADDVRPSWSRDGKWIYFGSNRIGQYQIWRIPSQGGAPTQFTVGGGYMAIESSDGRWLYFSRDQRGRTSIWRKPVLGGAEESFVDSSGRWFALGRGGIYHLGVKAGQIWYWDAAQRTRRLVAELPGPMGMGIAVSPDETELAFVQSHTAGSDLFTLENFR